MIATYKPRKHFPIGQASSPLASADGCNDDECFGEDRPPSSSALDSDEEDDVASGRSDEMSRRSEGNASSTRLKPSAAVSAKTSEADYHNELDSEIAHIERMLHEAQEVFDHQDSEEHAYQGEGEDDLDGQHVFDDEDKGVNQGECADGIPYSNEEGEDEGDDESTRFEDSLQFSWSGPGITTEANRSPVKCAPTIRDLLAMCVQEQSPQAGSVHSSLAEVRRGHGERECPPVTSGGHAPPTLPLPHSLVKMHSSNDAISGSAEDSSSARGDGRADSEDGYSSRGAGNKHRDRFHALAIAR